MKLPAIVDIFYTLFHTMHTVQLAYLLSSFPNAVQRFLLLFCQKVKDMGIPLFLNGSS